MSLTCSTALYLAAMSATAAPQATLTVQDLTPKFLGFYHEARAPGVTPDARFALWKQRYDFAAVPPTPDGERMARQLLDEAWPRYPSVLARIERGAAGMAPAPADTLDRVVAVLEPDRPVQVKLLAYVGALEGNAFTAAGADSVPTVALPVEQAPEERAPIMAHEFTHAVQIAMGTMKGGWVRTIGETALAEGLAMHVAQSLNPDRPPQSFVEITPGWLARATEARLRILNDVREAAASDKSEDVMRFTMGKGPSGIEREAYYAGWTVVDHWHRHGMSYAQIARIPEAEAPARIGEAITEILAQERPPSMDVALEEAR